MYMDRIDTTFTNTGTYIHDIHTDELALMLQTHNTRQHTINDASTRHTRRLHSIDGVHFHTS